MKWPEKPGLAVQTLESWQWSTLCYFIEEFLDCFLGTWGSYGDVSRFGFVGGYESTMVVVARVEVIWPSQTIVEKMVI